MKMEMARSARRLMCCTLMVSSVASAQNAISAKAYPGRQVHFTTDVGTAMSVDVSPDGRKIVFNLLGDIYVMSARGGFAKPIIQGASWDTAPRFSPDGRQLAYVSERTDQLGGIWLASVDGSNRRSLTGPNLAQWNSPNWSPDGRRIVVAKDLCPASIMVASGQVRSPTKPCRGDERTTSASFLGDGSSIALGLGQWPQLMKIDVSGLEGGHLDIQSLGHTRVAAVADTRRHAFPRISPDGKSLAYIRYDPVTDEVALFVSDPHLNHPQFLLALDNPSPWTSRGFDNGQPNYAFTPDSKSIIIANGGKIWRVPINGEQPRVIPFRAEVRQVLAPIARAPKKDLRNPTVHLRALGSPMMDSQGRTLFTAAGQLWVRDQSGTVRRLTSAQEPVSYAALSPDGRSIAYLTMHPEVTGIATAEGRSQLWMATFDTEKGTLTHVRLLTPRARLFTPPVWSVDGSRFVVTASEESGNATETSRIFLSAGSNVPALVQIGSAPDLTVNENAPWNIISELRPTVGPDDRFYWIEAPPSSDTAARVYSIRLDGSDRRLHRTLPAGIQIAAIAPDARHILFGSPEYDGTYLADLQLPENAASDAGIRKISKVQPTHLSWTNGKTGLVAQGTLFCRIPIETGSGDCENVQLALPRATPKGSVALVNVRIITMASGGPAVIESGTVVYSDDVIVAAGRKDKIVVPGDAFMIDGTGLTVGPGFIDVHKHAMTAIEPAPDYDADGVSELAYGFTTRFDPSSRGGDVDLRRAETAAVTGHYAQRYFYSGLPMGGPLPLDAAKARRIFDDYDVLGVSLFKDYVLKTRYRRALVLDAARQHGVGITQEGTGLERFLNSVADGYTAIEHCSGFDLPLNADVFKFLAGSGLNWTPQVTGARGDPTGLIYWSNRLAKEDPAELERAKHWVLPGYIEGALVPQSGEKEITYSVPPHFRRAMVNAAEALKHGVTISIGSHNPPGLYGHFEMWSLAMGGASPMEVLRAATINGAKKIAAENDIGSIEVGKLADLVVFSANPLDNIRNTTKIRYVIANGVIYDAKTMDRIWPRPGKMPSINWNSMESIH